MPTLTIEINDNAEWSDPAKEFAAALRAIADNFDKYGEPSIPRDRAGAKCGSAVLMEVTR